MSDWMPWTAQRGALERLRVRTRQVVGVAALGSFLGCAGMQPQLSNGRDRDDAYDRYDRYHRHDRDRSPSGPPDADALLNTFAFLAGLGAVVGVGYLVHRLVTTSSRPPHDDVGGDSSPGTDCTLPAASVRVCLSSRGYRFAIPSTATCASGSSPLHTIALTCADLDRPAHHACLDDRDTWWALRSWETCASRGYRDAPGDFVPPGRLPSEGVSPGATPGLGRHP